MKAPKCRSCGKEHWGSICRPEKSSAVRMDAPNQKDIGRSAPKASVAGNQAPPVDTNIIVAVDPSTGKDFGAKVIGRVLEDGRIEILSVTHSKAKFSKSDYQKAYMADLRTIKRLGLSVTVKQYRESLK